MKERIRTRWLLRGTWLTGNTFVERFETGSAATAHARDCLRLNSAIQEVEVFKLAPQRVLRARRPRAVGR